MDQEAAVAGHRADIPADWSYLAVFRVYVDDIGVLLRGRGLNLACHSVLPPSLDFPDRVIHAFA